MHRGAQTRVFITEPERHRGFEIALGCASHSDVEKYISESEELVLGVDGAFFEFPLDAPAHYASKVFATKPVPSAAATILQERGTFALLCYRRSRLFAFRDLNGLKPLYYARARNLIAFASERKALWKIGLPKTMRIIPGFLYAAGSGGLSRARLAQVPRLRERPINLASAASQLTSLLMRSIETITKGIDRVAVAFSGGLDSALTAAMTKSRNPRVELLSVGLLNSPELSTVQEYARQLNLPVTVEAFRTDLLEKYVRRVLWLIEEPNLMKVSVAVPLHWSAMIAARTGFKVLLCGQGSDELYGGYYKFARILDRKGRKALVSELYHSVTRAYEVNYERDEQATCPSGVELRTPFADLDVIRFSLTIPAEFKVRPGDDRVRKWVLREVARNIGVPEEIVWRRKMAIQHGTGVENAIRRLAKNQNLPVDSYLKKLHAEVIKMDSMP